VKSTNTLSRKQKKKKNKNPVTEQINNEKVSEIQDKPDDSTNAADKAAFVALDDASSNTTVSRSSDTGMKNPIM
jgi:hypothetical protein